jgi:MoxR-like ATPase
MTDQNLTSNAQNFRDTYAAIKTQVQKVIVGQEEIVDGVLTCLFVGGNVLLEGVPGLGKTLLIRTLSQALGLKFSRIQFTPDLMPADITGTTIVIESQDATGAVRGREFKFQPGPLFAQIVLADEINRATPKTQSAMLEAMQEKSVTVGGRTYPMEKPFFVMATQNPIEQEGTYPLPEAQLDRFFFKLTVGYATRDELHTVLDRTTASAVTDIKPVIDGPGILMYQDLVRKVLIAPHVQDYAVRAVLATHADNPQNAYATDLIKRFVRFGASPRAAQALVLGGKVKALLAGRAHVSIDDIKAIMVPALRHRVLLNFEAQAQGLTTDQIITDLIALMPADAGFKAKS